MIPTGGWFDILKVDIDFDKDIRGLGQYARRRLVSLEEILESEKTGEEIPMEEIKINHKKIYSHLQNRLNREPTEDELIEFIKRIIMHEAGHAGHAGADPKFSERPMEGAEYVAYMFMFPDSVYLALRSYLKHPETKKDINRKLLSDLGFYYGQVEFKKESETIRRLLNYVDRFAKTSKDKEQLIRIELAHRKFMTRFRKNNFPQNLNQAEARYNKKFHKFIKKLFGNR